MSSDAKERYSPEELNLQVETWQRLQAWIEQNPKDYKAINDHETASQAIMKYVDPFHLTYFRFFCGRLDGRNKEIREFLRLFYAPDADKLRGHIVRAMAGHVRGWESDATSEADNHSFEGNDCFSIFREILFCHVLPRYKPMHKAEDGERINFFRAYQQMFRYQLKTQVLKIMGWEGRKSELPDDAESRAAENHAQMDVRLGDRYGLDPVAVRRLLLLREDIKQGRRPRRPQTRAEFYVEDMARFRLASHGQAAE